MPITRLPMIQPLRKAVCSSLCRSYSNGSDGWWRSRDNYRWFLPTPTRWKDNDVYGHVNNAEYHSLFDTAINIYLLRYCGLEMNAKGSCVGYMIKNECQFYASAEYPTVYLTGMAVEHVGNTSVKYKTGLFAPTDPTESKLMDGVTGHFPESDPKLIASFSQEALVVGEYVHVFVDTTKGNKPIRIPDRFREQFERLRSEPE